MRKEIPGACDKLNESHRSRERQRTAAARDRGFRYNGNPISKHGVRKIWQREKMPFPRSGKCLICNKPAHACICKIEVRDETGKIIKTI